MRNRKNTQRKGVAPTAARGRGEFWDAAVVCAVALIVYTPSLFSGFIRDDQLQIVENKQIQSWQYLPRLLTTHLWSQQGPQWTVLFYRPLFSVWMLMVDTIGGLAPWFWHLSSIFLHVAATYLVFRLASRLLQQRMAALVAGLFFAVHPIHVDAVSWVSASNEILFTAFALGAMLLIVPEGDSDGVPPGRLAASVALYSAGLFAKETGVAMLPILLAFPLLTSTRPDWRKWVSKGVAHGAWYVGATGVYLAIRFAVLHGVAVDAVKNPWGEVFSSSPSILAFYLGKLLVPLRLSGSYVNPLIDSPTVGTYWLGAAMLAGAGAAAWVAVRYNRLVGLAVALVILPLLPALAVIRIYIPGDITHDRYLYMPSVGLALLLGLLAKAFWSRFQGSHSAIWIASACLLAGLGTVTVLQQKYYKDDEAFYQRILAVNPTDAAAIALLGNHDLDRGDLDVALGRFRQAQALDSHSAQITLFLVRGLFVAGRFDEAEARLRQLLQTDLPTGRRTSVLQSLANVKLSEGKIQDGYELLKEVENRDPDFPELHWALGVALQRLGQPAAAEVEYRREFQLTGDQQAEAQADAIARVRISSHVGPRAK